MSYIVATYSVNIGSTQEARSKTSITDVLSLLVDNTSKEISPRDVRDAIFSAWESSVIRYSSNGNYPYIGIDRTDVKDIKLFLGKKTHSSSLIITDDLVSNDTDIFFYNLKSDSATNQDLKISLLSGTSSAMHYLAPYLKSSYVASPEALSLDIVNPATYGTVGIQSGLSASITINNLTWPSRNYINNLVANPSNASASSASDLFLAVRSGGSIELLTYASGGGTLGSPGIATTIFGSPATLNGYSLEYTNLTPTVATFGGVSLGSTFSNVPLIDMISQMLYPYLEPVSTLTINSIDYGSGAVSLSYNNTVERKQQPTSTPAITINYSFTLTKRTNNISSTNFSLKREGTAFAPSGGWPSITLSGSGLVNQSYTGYSIGINGSSIAGGSTTNRNVFTFSLYASDGTSGLTSSTYFEVVYPYFYGFATTASTTGIASNQLGTDYSNGYIVKRIDKKTNQTLAVNSYALPGDVGYLHFMYPAIYGTLSSIQDGNDFVEYTHNSAGVWTYSSISITHPNGSSYWSGVNYYIYRKTIVTLIPPSQNYKFNF